MENSVREVMNFLDEAAALVKKLEVTEAKHQQLSQELKRLEKQKATCDRALSEETSMTIKSRREELAGEYDRQLAEANAELKAVTEKKEAAKTAGKKERTARETAGLRKITAELEAEQKKAMSNSNVSGLWSKSGVYHLFMPQTFPDYVLVAFVGMLLSVAFPYIVFKAFGGVQTEKLVLLCAVFCMLTTLIYMLVHSKVYLPQKDQLDDIYQRNILIRQNKKEIKDIVAAISEDQSEEYYHLEDFNYDIAKAEAIRDEIRKKREDALNNFDICTRKVISDEIRIGYDASLTELEIGIETGTSDLKSCEHQLLKLRQMATERYGGMLGQDNLSSKAIEGIRAILMEQKTPNLTEAINIYNGHGF